MSNHNCVQNGEREPACSFRFPVCDSLSGMRLSHVLTALSDMGGMLTHVIRILYMTSLSLTCSSYDPLPGYVFQCLVRSSMDHRAESHRVCSGASVVSMYGQQSRLHAHASLHSSHTRGSVCLVQSHMLATLMSAARASS